MHINIVGSGSYTPSKEVFSDDLDELHGLPSGFLEKNTGVRRRFFCDGENQIDMALQAALAAIADARLDVNEIDLIISACGIPYQTLPSTAPLLQKALDIADGALSAFDINSTCLSFLSAFETASLMLATGKIKNALIFSSEIASRALPWRDQPEIAGLFGDGAAAVVLQRGGENEGRIRACLMRTYPSAYEACQIGSGGTRIDYQKQPQEFAENALFKMNGKELFRITSKHFSRFTDDLLQAANWRPEDVDLVIPHQASPFALAHMARQLGFDRDRIVDIAADFGNQIAASIPTAYDFAMKAGRIHKGSKLLFLGTSAGVSFGGMALEV